MNIRDFSKMINDAKGFGKKIKMIRFVGNGEPLLHKDIAEMCKIVSDSNISEKIEIITNGSLLTPELSDKLVASGLTQIRISLQGLTEDDYKKMAEYDIDYNKFLDNLKYLFGIRSRMHINIKIPENMIITEDRKELFLNMFDDICDSYSIEKISPTASRVDYSKLDYYDKINTSKTLRGKELPVDIDICNHPFYLMLINPDGSVYPCCTFETPPSMGNVFDGNIVDVWRGRIFNDFRYRMLNDGVKGCGKTCSSCKAYLYNMFKEDVITRNDAEKLKNAFQVKGN